MAVIDLHDDAILDDYSMTFSKVRAQLTGANGQRYVDFVRNLKPDFAKVYRHIALGYSGVLLSVLVTHWLAQAVSAPLAVVIGALLIGYWVAYLVLFMHEGAHFNLAATHSRSDQLANLLIGWLVGSSAARYRIVHFQHHRALGTVSDSENTYFFPLNLLFVIKALTGLRVFEVLASRRKFLVEAGERKQERAQKHTVQSSGVAAIKAEPQPLDAVMITGLFTHVSIVLICLALGAYATAIAWVIGVCTIFPFLSALRQLLEHRDEHASGNTNNFIVNHGAYTRMFGDDPFSATFGGAGFNRHLLHHWEPQVSYTNLAELEAFFGSTPFVEIISKRRASYGEVFLKLFSLY